MKLPKLGLALLSAASMTVAAPTAQSLNEGYEYDALGRLTKVTQGDGSTIAYADDAAGNRTTISVAGSGTPDVNPNGPSVIVVVPLNGFTVIPVQ